MRRVKFSGFALVFLLVISASASSQVINVSTGLTGGGSPIAAGGTDPFWTIRTAGNGYVPSPTVVLSNADNAACFCGIIPNSSAGQWISDRTGIATGWGAGPTA